MHTLIFGAPYRHRQLAVAISLLTLGASAYAADSAGKPLRLDDAVRIAIKNSPKIIMESVDVDLAKANEQEAGGVFDPTVTAGVAYDAVRGYQYPQELQQFGSNPNVKKIDFMTEHINNTEFKTGLTKLFRNGVYTDFSIALQSSDDAKKRQDIAWNVVPNMQALGIKPGVTTEEFFPAYPSRIQLLINVPLLKMRGEHNLPAANEASKRYQREAAELTLKHDVASIIRNVVDSFWAYKDAQVLLQYQLESQRNIERWLASLEKRVGPAQNASKELAHLRGYLTQQHADVAKAREDISQARNALALALGISAAEARALGPAQDDYPMDWTEVLRQFDDAALQRRWNDIAQQNRPDLKAAALQLEAATAIFLGAQNDELPKLDLALILKQQGLAAGGSGVDARIDSLRDGSSDLGYTLQLSYAMPLGNNKAKSLVTKTRFGKLQAEVQYADARRSVNLAVDTAVNTVRTSLTVLDAARKQTEHAVAALDALIKDDVVEPGQVFDLVVLENARMDAVGSHIKALLAVANAVTMAHFQTGLLIKDADNVQEISIGDLSRLP